MTLPGIADLRLWMRLECGLEFGRLGWGLWFSGKRRRGRNWRGESRAVSDEEHGGGGGEVDGGDEGVNDVPASGDVYLRRDVVGADRVDFGCDGEE
jgi:hypothetical protein